MKKYEDMINEEVEYWVEEFIEDDYNVFKMEMDEDFDIEVLDEKLLSEYISSMWKDRNYLYVELNYTMLLEEYLRKMRKWKNEREEWDRDYWYNRGL
jgi:hypothetical protein